MRARNHSTGESGYILLGVLVILLLMAIALSAAIPSIVTQIRRDREDELIRRGNQYAKAIRKYYKKFGRYPTSIEQLESTNNLRFLRRRYKDPITGKDEWRLIRFGQQKTQPRTFGGPQQGGAGAAAGALGGQQTGGQFGQQPGSQIGQSLGGQQFGSQIGQQPGSQIGQQIGQPLGGSTMGGGPIVGVSSTSEAESLKELNGKNHYNEWEFVYDPRFDPTSQQQGMPGQQGLPGQRGGPQSPAGPGGGRSTFPQNQGPR